MIYRFCLIILLGFVNPYAALLSQTNYFVSINGKDSGDGSIHSPFKSITKALAKHPSFPYPSVLRGKLKESSVLEWSGLSLKNLETLGERSATGMDSERGVYVISVRVMSNPLRDYIYANDVILGFNRQEINNLTQLKAAIRQADTNKPVQILLFRNQKKMQLTIPGNIIKPTTD